MDDRAIFLSHDYEGMKRIIDSIENLDKRTKKILEMKNLLSRTLAQMEATDVMPVDYYLKKFEIYEGKADIIDITIYSLIVPIKESEAIKVKQDKKNKVKGNILTEDDFVNVILEGKEIKIILNEQNDTDLKWLFEGRKKDYRNDIKFLEQELEHVNQLRKYGNELNILDGHFKKEEDETQRKKIIEYLVDNQPDFMENYAINISALALEITNYLYPTLKGKKETRKKDAIRQELMQIKKGKIPFE